MLFQRLKNWLKPDRAGFSAAVAEQPRFTVPVLCYHSWTMEGDRYEGNDHLALAQDLRALGGRGYRVLPLPRLVKVLRGELAADEFSGMKLELLEHARKKTTQKVNLFEKVQIPGYKDAIRKVKRFMEDEESLSKSSQKIMRSNQEKRNLKEEEEVA